MIQLAIRLHIFMYIYYIKCCVYIAHRPYDISPSVQLVCKYLRAYKYRDDLKKGINRLYIDNGKSYIINLSCI